jgi:tetratricopeptide (TPR) repeat protein
MKRISIDQIAGVLPSIEELQPLLDRVLRASEPDLDRHWAGSGELGTIGGRFVDSQQLDRLLTETLEEQHRELTAFYEAVGAVLRAVAAGDRESAAAALLEAARREKDLGRPRRAVAFAEAAARVGAALPGRATLVAARLTGARAARVLGDVGSARLHYLTAARIADEEGDRSRAVTAHIGLGNLAVDQGLWADALRHYSDAEARVESAADESGHGWQIALNRSIVAREEARLDECEALLAEARRLAHPGENGGIRAILTNAEGQLLRERGHLEDADLAFRQALEATEDPDARVTITINLADVLLAQGAVMEAGDHARQAEGLALKAGVVRRLPEVYRTLARVAAARGHEDAFVFHDRALEIIRERSLPQVERALVLEGYGELDHARGETESGTSRLREAIEIYKELGYASARARATQLLRRLEGA